MEWPLLRSICPSVPTASRRRLPPAEASRHRLRHPLSPSRSTLPINIPLPGSPIALPYTISTIAGGSTVSNANTTCAGSTDSFGDGCQATSMVFNGTVDLRSVVADPFGNVYLTDANASWCTALRPTASSATLPVTSQARPAFPAQPQAARRHWSNSTSLVAFVRPAGQYLHCRLQRQ